MQILIPILLTILSILLMGKGSDWLTDSLIPLARKLGISGVAVGLILVSIAVSLPEILVAVLTTIQGFPAISLGVVLGSIICNIGLMTGLCAIIRPLKVKKTLILRDGIFSLVIPILVFAIGAGGEITRLEGGALLLLFIPYIVNIFLQERRVSDEQKTKNLKEIELELDFIGFTFGKLRPGWLSFFLGTALLLAGAYLFSLQLGWFATYWSIDELIVGLTLGALGPSLPNIAAAYKATRKGMGEIAVSETLGSNVFTLLVTLGIAAMLSPVSISHRWLSFELPAMIFMSFLLFFFLLTRQTISRLEGSILLFGYLAIVAIQIFLAVR
ncbi:MAG: sodium:calcium antiporter [Candidatus Peribacteraceae bacterium]|nr:sodium:calcium antiporter [Candidatus Peribacteraceae bacterium]